jgi:hypothetical protein
VATPLQAPSESHSWPHMRDRVVPLMSCTDSRVGRERESESESERERRERGERERAVLGLVVGLVLGVFIGSICTDSQVCVGIIIYIGNCCLHRCHSCRARTRRYIKCSL